LRFERGVADAGGGEVVELGERGQADALRAGGEGGQVVGQHVFRAELRKAFGGFIGEEFAARAGGDFEALALPLRQEGCAAERAVVLAEAAGSCAVDTLLADVEAPAERPAVDFQRAAVEKGRAGSRAVQVQVGERRQGVFIVEFVPRNAAAQVVGAEVSPDGRHKEQRIFGFFIGGQGVADAVVAARAELFFLVGCDEVDLRVVGPVLQVRADIVAVVVVVGIVHALGRLAPGKDTYAEGVGQHLLNQQTLPVALIGSGSGLELHFFRHGKQVEADGPDEVAALIVEAGAH
jgi:hypothetical protein